MHILLLYATYSGGTETAAQTATTLLSSQSHEVTMKYVHEATPDEITQYDCIVLMSPSWANEGEDGQPHQYFLDFIKQVGEKTFPLKKFAILGLGDSVYPKFCGAVDKLEAFVKTMQGELTTPSLRIDGFYFDLDNNTKKVEEWATHLSTLLK